MKLQFKHQKFQADAAKAVVDVFAGQPYLTPTYMMDRGYGQQTLTDDTDFTGWRIFRKSAHSNWRAVFLSCITVWRSSVWSRTIESNTR